MSTMRISTGTGMSGREMSGREISPGGGGGAGRISLESARERLASSYQPFVEVLKREDCCVELYQPEEEDKQHPHAQDELYVIARGHGVFKRGGERTQFAAGDVIFVPAWMEHRFEDFSDDFQTWVIFVGPKR